MRKSDVVFAMTFDEARSVRDSKEHRGRMRGLMTNETKREDEMRSHYDFSGGVRGKYAASYGRRMPTIEIYANGVLIGRVTLTSVDDGMNVGTGPFRPEA